MNPEAIEAAKVAVAKEMRLRTYDRHAHNDDVFEEGVADIAAAALEAAAPYLLREARAADEPTHDGWDRIHFEQTGCDGSLHTIGDCLAASND